MFIRRFLSGKYYGSAMKELLLAVDDHDRIKRFATKLDCHRISHENSTGICHRAFSLFLFDRSTGDMLLQKRSALKVTFPLLWSNAVCSHPILNKQMNELQGVQGILNAVCRRFKIEMGYAMPKTIFDTLKYVGRVKYTAQSSCEFYENEIDYIVFGEIDKDSYSLNYNSDEIEQLMFCSIDYLHQIIHEKPTEFTPWLKRIVSSEYLQRWFSCYRSKKYSTKNSIIRLN